ncbi:MAG: Ig-like domain-containing protein [Chryseosolibacter sp.]
MKTKKLWISALAGLFLAFFIGGCVDENVETVGVCPLVLSTDPANLATNVPLDKAITVTFNESMNPTTITPGVLSISAPNAGGRKAGIANISGELTYDASTYTMRFIPGVKLEANTTYTATVGTSVKDLMGNALQTPYVWTFSTGATVYPIVISTDATHNATNVPLNKQISATFSMPMDPATLTGAIYTIQQGSASVTGTITYAGNTVTFKPASDLAPNTVYSGMITTGAANLSGIGMKNDYAWTFTTGLISAPKVNSTDPANLASGVPLNKVISATFSEAMDAATISSASFKVMHGTDDVAGRVNYAGTTATFTPTSNLLSGVTYTATITIAAQNIAGAPLANDYVWQFNTNATLGPLAVDLKTVGRFGIIAGVGVSNNAGFSEIRNLDVGISPGVRSSITGFPPAIIVNGAMYASDDIAPPGVAAMLSQAKLDLTEAYLFAEGATSPAPATVAGDQGGLTLAPGIYKSTSTLLIQAGDLTLDAQGDANAVWIFQIASDFTTVGGAGGNVILTGGAQAKNVFWQVGSSATIGDFTQFKGTILALTSITMNSGATAVGRMLARNGSVVMTNTNIIEKP